MASNMNSTESSATLVEQFCAITGATTDVGERLLEVCAGDLDMAIGMQMDSGSSGETGTKDAVTAAAPPQEDEVRAPIPQKKEVLVEEAHAFGLRNRRRQARSVFDAFRDFQAEAKQQELAREGRSEEGTSKGAKRKTLEDLFRPPIDLIHKASFHSARDIGSQRNKWLMVNIQNVKEFTCQVLNRDLWSNAQVKEIVQEHFVFWQVYHDSAEGLKFMQFYKINNWPYIAVIDPRTGESMVEWHKIDPLSFADLVTDFLASHPSPDGALSPPAKRAKKSDSIVDASEDSQLEAAIQASLAQTEQSTDITHSDEEVASSDEEELETFTDSDSESLVVSSPQKSFSGKSVKSSSKFNHSSVLDENSCSSRDSSASFSKKKSTSKNTPKNSPRNTPKNTPKKEKTATKVKTPPKENTAGKERTESKGNTAAKSESNGSCSKDKNGCSSGGGETYSGESTWEQYLGSNTDSKTNLMIRFPDGKKVPLSIPKSSKLKAVVQYVIEKGYSNERFELITTFPRRKLSLMDFDQTLNDIDMHQQETVFVQER